MLSLAWSLGSEHQLLSGDASGEVRLWDVRRPGSRALLDYNQTARPPPRGRKRRGEPAAPAPGGRAAAHDGGVTSILAVPDGLHWVTGGRDARLRLWDAAARTHLLVHYHGMAEPPRRPLRLAATEDGRALFRPSGAGVRVRAGGTGSGLGRGRACKRHAARDACQLASLWQQQAPANMGLCGYTPFARRIICAHGPRPPAAAHRAPRTLAGV